MGRFYTPPSLFFSLCKPKVGKLLFRSPIAENVSEVNVPSYRLNEGVNLIVLVDDKGEIIGTGKALKK